VRDFVAAEARFAILERTHPERARRLSELLQADADERWRYYEQLAGMHRTVPHEQSVEIGARP
jgi:pyruvate-ferredoxin/flavodoxin oxidoreductase